MKAIILVGGQGTRLRPLTDHVPKNVVPLCNAPFLTYQIDQLKKAGVRDIVFSVGYKPQAIRRIYGDGRRLGVRIRYAVESKPLGTAGAIKNAERFVAGHPVFVMNGDILSDLDLSRLRAFHRKNHAVATLGLTRVEDPSAYGLVLLDRQGRVQKFLEKPAPGEVVTDVINAGIYLFEPEVFRHIPAKAAFSAERALFPNLLGAQAPLYGFVWKGYWQDIGTPQKYLSSHWDILSGRFPVLLGLRKGRDLVYWGRRVRRGKDVVVIGPSIVGNGCVLEDGARVGPFAVLGDGCRVGCKTIISRSLLWEGADTGDEALLSEVILGRKCRLGDRSRLMPGSILADFTRG